MSPIKKRVTEAMKTAMKRGEKNRLTTIRLILSAIKQDEIDNGHKTLSEEAVIQILSRLAKQRRESIQQYAAAQREDLRQQEEFELDVIHEFLPPPLDEASIKQLIDAAIQETAATQVKDLGSVLRVLRPKLQGRADLKKVSEQVRSLLSG